MNDRDVVLEAEVLDIYTELYDNMISKAKVLDVYTELYDKFVLMFMQALFKTFYNEAAAGMEVTIKRRDKDDDC